MTSIARNTPKRTKATTARPALVAVPAALTPASGVEAASCADDTIGRAELWAYVGGMSEAADELNEALAEAAGKLRRLAYASVDCSEELRSKARLELAWVLLDAFERSVHLRTVLDIVGRMAKPVGEAPEFPTK